MSITLLLLVAALICFLLAAFKVTFARIDLVALGLGFVTVANLVRVLVPLLMVLSLTGCAISYQTAKGDKWSVNADPDSKQIRAAGKLLF